MSATADANLTGNLLQQTHFHATLWQIVLADGVTTYRFTDHDSVLSFEVTTGAYFDFSPVGGYNPTATTFELGLIENNKDFQGPVDAVDASDTIVGPTYQQLRSGQWRDAEVDEWIVDWRVPWAGYLKKNKYWTTDIEFDNETFNMSVDSLGRRLKEKRGDVYSRNCRWDLGRDQFGNVSTTSGCRYNVNSDTEGGTISSITTQRLKFVTSGLSVQSAGYWERGRIRWDTGSNKGMITQVARHTAGPTTLTLVVKLPFDMTVGDAFTIEPGCARTSDACVTNFSNIINFGGPGLYSPGNDTILQVPRR